MMSKFQDKLEKYAELAVKVGINVQPGQTLVINAPIAAADFARAAAKKAYEVGAKNVLVEWNDEQLTKIKFDHAPDEAFEEFPMWKAKGFEELAENGAGFLSIVAQNPDLLKGVDPKKIQTSTKTAGKAMEKFRNYTQADKVSWTVIAAPTKEWAEKVFPETNGEESIEKLWEAIFDATRVNLEDPVAAWKEHSSNLISKVKHLNAKQYKKLHYKAPGTDLTIELPDQHVWVGGGGPNEKGVNFVANMPTEEVFTAPKRDGVNGTVTSTKPLSYAGNLIENFSLTFENGSVVDFTAENGYDTLKQLIETDEGSRHLGEIALVPHDSPISNTGIIFFNTLFDENASNHLALGNAYAFNIEGGKTMTRDELKERGVNSSITHVDFMIGSAEMNIDGVTAEGTNEPLFRNGNWAF
jgi:aminopeptidase